MRVTPCCSTTVMESFLTSAFHLYSGITFYSLLRWQKLPPSLNHLVQRGAEPSSGTQWSHLTSPDKCIFLMFGFSCFLVSRSGIFIQREGHLSQYPGLKPGMGKLSWILMYVYPLFLDILCKFEGVPRKWRSWARRVQASMRDFKMSLRDFESCYTNGQNKTSDIPERI